MRGCEVERGDWGTGCFKKTAGQRIKSQEGVGLQPDLESQITESHGWTKS